MEIEASQGAHRDVPDFPQDGIVFKDITPLLADPVAFSSVIDLIVVHFGRGSVDKVVGIEARGFIIASPVAYHFGAGFVPVRKKDKLPRRRTTPSTTLEYGTATLEIHKDGIDPGRARPDRRRRPRHGRDGPGHGRPRGAHRRQGRRHRVPDRARLPARTQPARGVRAVHADQLLSRPAAFQPRRTCAPRRSARGGPRAGQDRESAPEDPALLSRAPAGRARPGRARFASCAPSAATTPRRTSRRSSAPTPSPKPHTWAEADVRRGLHQHPLAVARVLADLRTRHHHPRRRPAARHRRGHRGDHRAARGGFGDRGRPHRRRAHQARPLEFQHAGAGAGRERPQDDRRDGRRHPRPAHQARRPAPQHAHPRRSPATKQRRIATETLEIYAPLAHRLGVQRIKWELEDLAFKTLHPGPIREIANLVEKRRGERQDAHRRRAETRGRS